MIQSIRPVVIPQDENVGVIRREAVHDKENNVLGAKSFLSNAKQPLQSAPARKALGNITNTTIGNSNSLGKQQDGKPRKALGDISNSGSLKAAPISVPAKPIGSRIQIKPSPALPNVQPALANRTSVPKTKAEVFAMDGVEKLAGKSWTELEADRRKQQDEAINRRVHLMTSALPMWQTAHMLQVCAPMQAAMHHVLAF